MIRLLDFEQTSGAKRGRVSGKNVKLSKIVSHSAAHWMILCRSARRALAPPLPPSPCVGDHHHHTRAHHWGPRCRRRNWRPVASADGECGPRTTLLSLRTRTTLMFIMLSLSRLNSHHPTGDYFLCCRVEGPLNISLENGHLVSVQHQFFPTVPVLPNLGLCGRFTVFTKKNRFLGRPTKGTHFVWRVF